MRSWPRISRASSASLVLALVVALAFSCGDDADPRGATRDEAARADTPLAPSVPTAPATEAARSDARLAVLRGDQTLEIVDAHAPASPPLETHRTPGASRILDVAAGPRLLLGGADLGVLLVDGRGPRILDADAVHGRFFGEEHALTLHFVDHRSCGGAMRLSRTRLWPLTGGSPSDHEGTFVGIAASGVEAVLEREGIGRCRPAGGRELAPRSFALLRTDGSTTTLAGPRIALAARADGRVVGRFEVDSTAILGDGLCAFVATGAPAPAPDAEMEGPSCSGRWLMTSADGRYVAASTRAPSGGPELRVFSTRDGALVGRHDAGVAADRYGLASIVRGCFSPDGERLAVARGDGQLLLTTPRGEGAAVDLGEGTCEEFSPDGRHLLVATKTAEPRYRVITLDPRDEGLRVTSRDLGEGVRDARFLSARATDR